MSEQSKCTRQYREKLLADPYRPGYHFAIPDGDGNPGDPNGAFFADGRYHLMYLYHCDETDSFHWGHMSSLDLLHWRQHPDALTSLSGDRGCNSGGAFVDEDGTAYLTFWKFAATDGSDNSGVGIAKSRPPYDKWERITPLAIYGTEWGWADREINGEIKHIAAADPSNIWKQGDYYYFQTGNCPILDAYGRGEKMDPRWRKSDVAIPEYQGDWTDLFRSTDLVHWEYVHRFYQNPHTDADYPDETEDDMCPTLLPLPDKPCGGKLTDRYLQTFFSHNRGGQYYIGRLENEHFYPTEHGRFTWNNKAGGVPEAMIDGKNRHLVWFWLIDNISDNEYAERGWSGVFTVPRTMWYDGGFKMAVPDEFEQLQYNEQRFSLGVVADTAPIAVKNGTSCRIRATVKPNGADVFGFRVLADENGEYVDILIDRAAGELVMDTTHSGKGGWPVREQAPFVLADGEDAVFDILIDHAVIEVFVNDRQAISRRAYPTNPAAAVNVHVIGNGADFGDVNAYEMMPTNWY